MLKAALFDSIQGIDESYGSYFEDTDFFMKAMKSGLRLGVAKGTLVTHRSQGTFKKLWTEQEMKENFDKNKAKYEEKYGGQYPYLN